MWVRTIWLHVDNFLYVVKLKNMQLKSLVINRTVVQTVNRTVEYMLDRIQYMTHCTPEYCRWLWTINHFWTWTFLNLKIYWRLQSHSLLRICNVAALCSFVTCCWVSVLGWLWLVWKLSNSNSALVSCSVYICIYIFGLQVSYNQGHNEIKEKSFRTQLWVPCSTWLTQVPQGCWCIK